SEETALRLRAHDLGRREGHSSLPSFCLANEKRSTFHRRAGRGIRFRRGTPPPKTLITPALFSRPLPTPHTGRRGRAMRNGLAGLPPLPGRERGLGGEGFGWGRLR